MSLIGKTAEEQIWNFSMARIGNGYGVAALMGNLDAESGLNPKNLENLCERLLRDAGKPCCTDETYTAAVDGGEISREEFLHPLPGKQYGYGLAQWTSAGRKGGLYDYVKSKGASIGDLEAQLEYLFVELSSSYKTVLSALETASSVRAASDIVLKKFECPKDQSEAVQVKRAGYGEEFYRKYAGAGTTPQNGGNHMGSSTLVDCTVLSPNHSGKRTKALCRITPHCVVGQLTAEGIGGCFTSPSRQASCNYGIGTEGRVVLVVDEANRSWCSSSSENDQQAVTIECASDKTEPYAFNSKVYNKLIDLCVDICRRNGKKKLLWLGSREKTLVYTPKSDEMVLTAHRWFSAKACPGDWLYSRYGNLADRVNALLGSSDTVSKPVQAETPPTKSLKVGDIVDFIGNRHYTNANASGGSSVKPGQAKITAVSAGAKHPYHIIHTDGKSTVYGWVDEGDIRAAGSSSGAVTHTVVKGDTLSALAKRYGTTVARIVAANKSKYPKITASYIVVGWMLTIN
ncbi:MAG: phage tail tip lysozyme [Lachnoclostridium sp.]|nr:phage tail tip lysozyme [Lachnoclostridium sp.]MCM1384211.1 phage tail tip lysozyme [Lachnoclostridium sp.]